MDYTFSLRSASLTGRATALEGLGTVVSDMVTGAVAGSCELCAAHMKL
jgi:hypothetical protein